MATIPNPVTTVLAESSTTIPPAQRKVTLGPANVVAYMFQGTGVFMCLDIIAWPMEVARTRMQACKENRSQSTFRLLSDIARTEGPTKLFRGLGPFLLTSLPSQFVYLGVYEHATTVIERSFPDHHNSNSAIRQIAVAGTAGFLAEAMSASLYVPTDIISQRLRVQSEAKGGVHKTSIDIFKSIYRTEGLRGYYQGFMATLLAFTPSSVTHWAGYEATKKMLFNQLYAQEQKQIRQDKHDGFFAKHCLSQNNALIVGLSALNASVLSLIVSSPFDMVRVRLQLLDSVHRDQADQLRKGWWSMVKLIAKVEGVHGFFKGMAPKIMAAIPGGVGYLFAYEYIKDNLEGESSCSTASSSASTGSIPSVLPPAFSSA
ncbi:hypothetical protein BGZ65_012290 [Modicella reniformis]|uniref:Mitochondrial carrier protein n=1 Tax=Modicella reniformis TaxID=1440133 RepID=A0A9P6SUZ5_9FUNG|nr:hypothetical protein BGZ65_012290 [Modicella reniformis]